MAIAFRANGATATGTTSLACGQPTGTATDDCLVAFIVDHATTGTSAAPTGWTNVANTSGANGRFQAFTAVVGKNGLTGTSWTFSGLTTRAVGYIVGFSGANVDFTKQPDVTATARSNASGTTGTTQLTPGNNGDMVCAGFAAFASGSTWSAQAVAVAPVLSNAGGGANSTFCSVSGASGILATAAATGASSATMGTAGVNAGILLSLKAQINSSQTLTETATISDTLVKSPTKIESESVAVADTLSKAACKKLTDSATMGDTFARGTSKTLTETVSAADTLTKGSAKGLTETVTLADTVTRSLIAVRTLNEALTLTDTLTRDVALSFNEALALADIFGTLRAYIQTLLETVALSDNINFALSKELIETVALADDLAKQAAKSLNESVATGDALVKSSSKGLSEQVSFSDTLNHVWAAVRTLSETLALVDSVNKEIEKPLAPEILSLADTFLREAGNIPPAPGNSLRGNWLGGW